MSHELRTPLNAIIGFSEILSDQIFGTLNEKQARQVQHVLNGGRHLLSLINDILDLSKVESGKMELEVSPVNISALLNSCLSLIKERALKHGLKLQLAVAEELDGRTLPVDERKMKQIIFNLLSNAVKFTPDRGEIAVKASVKGRELEISVADTGIGIAEKDQQRVFEEFVQVDSSYGRTQQGTGLGLALTRKLVELHGGRIRVESEGEGRGSIFTFTIPFSLEERQEKQ